MFENTPEALVERLEMQVVNGATYKTAIGASVDELTEVLEDHGNLSYLIAYANVVETNKKTVNGIKNVVYDGDEEDEISAFPVFQKAEPPFPLVKGIKKRFEKRNTRWKTAPGYTKEIGIALGIIQGDTDKPSTDSLEAASKQRDLGGYQFEGDFKKQGMTAMLYQIRVKGTEKWIDAKTALTSPVIITIDAPAIEGAAVQIEVRCRLMKGNELVGEWSPIYPLTVNP